ncbi:MAG: PCMD domain-containing protein [Bacteroidales bacterium]|nr:PCMD domain-containing protein [Bacteroidales bacterium]
MKKLLIIFTFISILISCEEDESSNADILEITVNSISNDDLIYESAYIDTENNKVFIFINNDLLDFAFPITRNADIKLSSSAKTSSISNNELNFSNPNEVKMLEVEAEDGTVKNWYIYLVHHQIQNSDFEHWFDNMGMDGGNYQEIGSSLVTSVWATANIGTSMYKVYCTQPLTDGSNTFAEITTGETTQLPITAGTLFTGVFSLAGAIANPTDPEQATIFGTPFIFRPTALKFKFKYQAGENYIQATLIDPSSIFGGFTIENIEGEDQCTIYAFLEIRNGDQVTEIARTEMDSGTTDDILTETLMTFNYTSSENPTHITIVFSSSTDGALWKGAVGSSLVIDDLELIYE